MRFVITLWDLLTVPANLDITEMEQHAQVIVIVIRLSRVQFRELSGE